MPGWSWKEDFDTMQRARLAGRIVAELDARTEGVHGPRFYAVIGHPVLSRRLEKALEEIASNTGNLWKVVRPKRPDAYVTPDPGLFAKILPVLFEFGPPEISVFNFCPSFRRCTG